MGKNMALGIVVLIVSASHVNAITCNDGVKTLMPCLPFLKDTDPSPTVPCCLGVQNLDKMASSTEDRRTLCDYFKKAAASLGIDYGRAKQLPDLCHVSLPVPLDPNVNCTSISFKSGVF